MALSLEEDTRLLAYRYESYEGASYRFRDDPLEGEYDTGAWAASGGSIIGAFTGASMLLPLHRWGRLGRGLFELGMGGIGSILGQSLWEEEFVH